MYHTNWVILLLSSLVICVVSVSENKVTNETLSVKNVNATSSVNTSLPKSGDNIVAAPMQPPTNGREGVVLSHATERTSVEISNKTIEMLSSSVLSTNETANLNVTTKPIVEAPSKISARKGVSLPESPKIEPTVSVVKKKPTVTENSDDDDHSLPADPKSSKNVNINEFVPDNKEHKRAAYLIPIIAVIFSVPLVAVIISVLYKRGAEWWQHRHYRRMDFLIEGMYNN